jgi:hypothetical protein
MSWEEETLGIRSKTAVKEYNKGEKKVMGRGDGRNTEMERRRRVRKRRRKE